MAFTYSIRTLCLSLLLLALLTCAVCRAQYRRQFPLPTTSVADSLGVNIHFTDPKTGEMEQLARAGFHWVRMDFAWSGIERTKGEYDFTSFDRLMTSLKAYHIRPIFILDYGNDLYEKGAPRSVEARQAFVGFVKAGVTHFKGQGVLWEMWNEPNGQFWLPRANVEEYITLAMEVGKAIRAVAPNEWYIGPAVSGMDFAFMERCFQAGLLNYWDAVSFHPYRNTPPETAAQDYAHLRQILTRYERTGNREGIHSVDMGTDKEPSTLNPQQVTLISGEWGYSERYPGLSLELQSKYIVREYLTNLANDVPLSIWYDWHDDGTDAKEVEHHFGTVFNDYKPKPTYLAAQTLAIQLKGFTFNKRLALNTGSDDYCLLFSKGNNANRETRLVVWTADAQRKAHEVTLPTSAGGFEVVSYVGARSERTAARSGLKVTLTDAPQYIIPQRANPLLTLAAVWPSLKPAYIVADKQQTLVDATPATAPELYRAIGEMGGWGAFTSQLVATENPSEDRGMNLTLITGKRVRAEMTAHNRTEQALRLRLTLTPRGLPAISQEAQVLARDPLRVTAQTSDGKTISARVENPTGKAWKGSVANGDKGAETPIQFAAGQKEKTVVLPVTAGPRNYTAQIVVRDIPSETGAKPILALKTPRMRFTPYENFDDVELPQNSPFEIVLDGNPAIEAQCETHTSRSDPDLPAKLPGVATIVYVFKPGWKFLRVIPHEAKRRPFPGKPYALGMWIRSDGSGDALRMRFTDATGQTFQPDAGLLDWKGWRYVEFLLQGSISGRWGGAEDGIIHYPIHVDTMLLVDSPGGRGGVGQISLAGVTLVEKL